jgi:hypothetical protein
MAREIQLEAKDNSPRPIARGDIIQTVSSDRAVSFTPLGLLQPRRLRSAKGRSHIRLGAVE